MTGRRFLLLVVFLPLVGCAERDEVNSYSVPRAEEDIGTGDVRLLAALVPTGEDTWFFKLVGRADVLQRLEPTWDGLLASLKYNEKGGLTWTVPEKWKEDRTNPQRFATLKSEADATPEITISKLPSAGAALKPNLDRWRRIDLGLEPISGRNVPKVTREKKVNNLTMTVVDMRGPGARKDVAGKMGMPPSKERNAPLTYKTPADWREMPSSSRIVVASFSFGPTGKAGRVLVTPLGGDMPGGLLGNINRWRQEVSLPSMKEEELRSANIRSVRVAGVEAKSIDLVGSDMRSVVVWLMHKDTTWFFKMLGPKETVDKQTNNFDAFLQSVTFPGDS